MLSMIVDLVGGMTTMSKAKAGDLTAVPAVRAAESFEQVKRIQARLDELAGRRAQVEQQLAAVSRKLADREQLEARTVTSLLEGDRLPDSLAPLDPEALRAEAGRLSRERDLLVAAAREGDHLLARARAEAQPAATRELRAWHQQVVAEAARRLCEAQRLLRLEEAARDAIEQAGFDRGALPAASPPFLANLDANPLSVWLTGLVAEGVLSGREPWLAGTGVDDLMSPDVVAAREVAHQRNVKAVEEEARRRSKANGDLNVSLAGR